MAIKQKYICTDAAPTPVGAYTQAVQAGNLLFLSGQIPLNPANGVVETGSIALQARLVLNNIKAVVSAAGATLSNVVQVTLYVTDMKSFPAVNEVYAEFFSTNPPARSCVEVVALPKNVGIEIDAIVAMP